MSDAIAFQPSRIIPAKGRSGANKANDLTDKLIRSTMGNVGKDSNPAAKKWLRDGDGLMIEIRRTSAIWYQEYAWQGKRTSRRLGVYDKTAPQHLTIAAARLLRAEIRDQVDRGVNPAAPSAIADVAPARAAPTFAEDAETYVRYKCHDWVADYRTDWLSSLRTYAYPALGERPTCQITADEIALAIQPIWSGDTALVKADVILDRIKQVIEHAMALHPALYQGKTNPADHADKRLVGVRPQADKPHGSVPYQELPALYAKLVAMGDDIPARGLRFLLLCCCPRRDEVLRATWGEIKGVDEFHVPASRLKRKTADKMRHPRGRVIPLSQPAQDLLAAMRCASNQDPEAFIFPTKRKRRTDGKAFAGHMHRSAMTDALQTSVATEVPRNGRGTILWDRIAKRVDPETGTAIDLHGLRASFRTWVSENRRELYDIEAAEVALDHTIGTKVTRAYARSDLLVERANLADRWARFLTGQ